MTNLTMTSDEFMQKMLAAFPNAVAETDNEGQLVIYTNLIERDGLVVDLDEPNLIGL